MRLLLVEDDLDLGAALLRSLEAARFETLWVRRLGDGVAHLRDGDFHALVLDIGLPDGEGHSLLAQARAAGDATPVLVVTARSALDERLRALNGGADDYVVKPFATEELIARLHALIRRAHGFSAPCWTLGDLEIDTARHEVRAGNVAVALTPREFAILVELAMARGRVVTRDGLVERVWGGCEPPSDGAIEYQMHGLRRKLGAARIRTLRGVGYALVVSSP